MLHGRRLQLKSKPVRHQTLKCSSGASCGRVFFPQGLIESSRSSIAQSLRRRNGKLRQCGRSRLAWGVRATRRNPREGQAATANSRRSGCRIGRRSPEGSQESLVRHTVGQARGRRVQETSLASSTCPARGKIAYTDEKPSCASARQSGLARQQADGQTGRRAATLRNRVRLLRGQLSVAHGDVRSFLPELSGALCGLPSGPARRNLAAEGL